VLIITSKFDTSAWKFDIVEHLQERQLDSLRSVVQNVTFECSRDGPLTKWAVSKLQFYMKLNLHGTMTTTVIQVIPQMNKMSIKVYTRGNDPFDFEVTDVTIQQELKLKLLGLVVKDYIGFMEALS